jgi:hypothetical protein
MSCRLTYRIKLYAPNSLFIRIDLNVSESAALLRAAASRERSPECKPSSRTMRRQPRRDQGQEEKEVRGALIVAKEEAALAWSDTSNGT